MSVTLEGAWVDCPGCCQSKVKNVSLARVNSGQTNELDCGTGFGGEGDVKPCKCERVGLKTGRERRPASRVAARRSTTPATGCESRDGLASGIHWKGLAQGPIGIVVGLPCARTGVTTA